MGRGLAIIAALLMLEFPTILRAATGTIADLPAGTYSLDKKHASVIAKVMHMGVSFYTVRFDTLDAGFSYDPVHPQAAQVHATVAVTSLDVGADYSRRFADEFLDASHFPTASFVSTAITPGADGKGTMTGDLTLRGVTRPVVFNVEFNGVGRGLFGGAITGFSAWGHIKRSDFGSAFLQNLVGDDVTLQIEAEFDRK